MTRLRVLHVAEPTDYGVATCVAGLAADQVAQGWQVAVLSPHGGSLAAAVVASGAVHHRWDGGRAITAVPGDVRRIGAVVAEERPHVVHLHSSRAGIAGRLAVRRRVPTLFQPHAWSFFAAGRAGARALVGFERLAARWTTAVVCCSDAERSAAVEREIHAPFVVARNAVDLDRFGYASDADRRAARAALGLGDHPIAVCVARISPQKGQRDLIDAWRVVRREVTDAELILVGDGPDRTELEARREPGVTFAGHADDVRPWVAAADLVTVLSRYEGLSLAVLEAMAMGRPLVTAAAEGMIEVIGSGNEAAGAVVDPGDLDGVASAITRRLLDGSLSLREGERGRARVEARHDKRAWQMQLRELTEAVASGTFADVGGA